MHLQSQNGPSGLSFTNTLGVEVGIGLKPHMIVIVLSLLLSCEITHESMTKVGRLGRFVSHEASRLGSTQPGGNHPAVSLIFRKDGA